MKSGALLLEGLIAALVVIFVVADRPQGGLDPIAPPSGSSPAPVTAPAAPDVARTSFRRAPAEETPATPVSVSDAMANLRGRNLLIPVDGVTRKDLENTFNDPRDKTRVHEALDILAPRNTPVFAVESGAIEKLFTSVRGGLTIYQFDPTRTYCYYYAHLDHYRPGLKEHEHVERGDVIGYVGTTGNAPKNTPHLHFSVFLMTDKKHWWEGTALNPYDVWVR
jgi:peptidoglycan LD-endopeptidase LytH